MLELSCKHFADKSCHSCQWLALPYSLQLAQKEAELKRLLNPFILQNVFLPTVSSPLAHFRNKAKMVVSGSVERPVLGLLLDQNDPNSAVDLSDCPLYPASFTQLFPILKDFIGRAGLVPYNVAKKRGELKYILLTESQHNGAFMLRFVLRSEAKRALIERELPALLKKLPPHTLVSLNIQPQHAAILEGEQEIFLTENETIREYFNHIPLFIRPQSFFQTNPLVASKLYQTAQEWVQDFPIHSLWDLFCGVGGFGLHCAKALQEKYGTVHLTGIEISAPAIASARKSAQEIGLKQIHFASLDSAQFALNEKQAQPDLVIVNPPRRGIGQKLAEFLNTLGAKYLLYSSCNAHSMAKDLHFLSHYEIQKVQLFDMFPHTVHYETLVLLTRKNEI